MDRDIREIALDLKFYRKSSAIQFTLIKPNRMEERSTRIKPGSLLIEMAKGLSGEKSYDWKNKITIALSVVELGKLGLALEGKKTSRGNDEDSDFVTLAEFLHDPNIGSSEARDQREVKKLNLSGKKGTDTIMMRLSTNVGQNKFISFALEPEERFVLYEIVKAAIPRTLGW